MPEAPLYWFQTYLDYHEIALSMSQTMLDPCVLYRKKERKLEGIIRIQVEDTFCAGTTEFLS